LGRKTDTRNVHVRALNLRVRELCNYHKMDNFSENLPNGQ